MTNALLVSGHTLLREGKAYADVCSECSGRHLRVGHGRCSCGQMSPCLDSDAKRKAWHRQHKTEIRDTRSGANHQCVDPTPRATEVLRLLRSLGGRIGHAPLAREDLDLLGEHLTHIRVHGLCSLCGHPLAA